MEKISGILPSSPRVAAVDLKEAAPVRPGTPTFGRPEGVSSLKKAKIGETAGVAASLSRDRLDWKSKDMQQAAMAKDLSDRFFKSNTRAADRIADEDVSRPIAFAALESKPSGFDSESLDRVTGTSFFAGDFGPQSTADVADESASDAEQAQQPDGLYPKGSFIDFRA